MSRALKEVSQLAIVLFQESRVESAKALRWKEVGHVGGRALGGWNGCRLGAGVKLEVGG